MNAGGLENTGERVIEDEYKKSKNDYFIYLCHIATYKFALPYVEGKRILEFGCGSGYGSNILAGSSSHVTAVDISRDAIDYAEQTYVKDNLDFRCIGDINVNKMDLDDESFDVVVSFQVVEHLTDADKYIDELYRVLKKGGTLIVVTPDKTTRLFRFQKPWNMYHMKEYSMEELRCLVGRKFRLTDEQYMTARQDLVDMEMRRTKRLKMLSLPFTLFFLPDNLRVFSISLMKRLLGSKTRAPTDQSYDFDVDDISIHHDSDDSINIFVIADKR